MEKQEIKHESFATLQICRVQGDSGALFGSSIEHTHFIELRICPAVLQRDLGRDWIFGRNIPYITVKMSNTQFAEAITSMNLGSGTPVTIVDTCFDGKYKKFESPPTFDKRRQMDNEFENQMQDIARKTNNLQEQIISKCEKLPQKTQTEIRNMIGELQQEIKSNIPFIKKQFTEQMDKTALEAKGEVEGFFLHKVQSLGLKELKMQDVLQIKGEENNLS